MDGTQVLIAEDNANSARLIADYLAAKGAQTTWKKDGGEAPFLTSKICCIHTN